MARDHAVVADRLGLFVGLAFLVAPISSLVAGFFLDELAERVEGETTGTPGRALPAGQAVWLATKFAGVSVLVNLVALMVFLLPGVNVTVFFVANGYLLGREYFELAALRYRTLHEAHEMRRRHRLYIFLCGLLIACFVVVPIVNLLTPLFGVALMVRIHQRLSRGEDAAPRIIQADADARTGPRCGNDRDRSARSSRWLRAQCPGPRTCDAPTAPETTRHCPAATCGPDRAS